MSWAVRGIGVAALAGAGVAWLRRHPSPLPYSQRRFVQGPHPGLSHEALREVLDPQAGERILEVGPGTGHFTLPVARAVTPGGTMTIVDVIPEWLDHTTAAARDEGLDNVVATEADARSLPFEDGSFDAAFLVQVLGEVPDQDAALAELRRVLEPDGRLVVGESIVDPHFVSLPALRQRATVAGLVFQQLAGWRLAYFARFRPDGEKVGAA